MPAREILIHAPGGRALAGLLHEPEGARRASAVLLAHGAGADMTSPFLEAIAGGLERAGFLVLRFRYPYMQRMAEERCRLPPDRRDVLEQAHEAALAELARRGGDARLLLAGKSLGGRIGTHLAAAGADVRGLVLLGYPLHPPGRPDRERREHFPAIVQPALFLQGTRDRLCELERLRRALATFGGCASLEVIEGADHDFRVPRSSGRTETEVRAELVARIDDWERRTFA